MAAHAAKGYGATTRVIGCPGTQCASFRLGFGRLRRNHSSVRRHGTLVGSSATSTGTRAAHNVNSDDADSGHLRRTDRSLPDCVGPTGTVISSVRAEATRPDRTRPSPGKPTGAVLRSGHTGNTAAGTV